MVRSKSSGHVRVPEVFPRTSNAMPTQDQKNDYVMTNDTGATATEAPKKATSDVSKAEEKKTTAGQDAQERWVLYLSMVLVVLIVVGIMGIIAAGTPSVVTEDLQSVPVSEPALKAWHERGEAVGKAIKGVGKFAGGVGNKFGAALKVSLRR